MKLATRISRIIVGLVFTFSGFVKGIDPMGSAYKLSDYFTALGLEFLDPVALPLAVILCLAEFAAGMMMLSGSFTEFSSWVVTLFMAVFTPLTLYLALYNPVSDCGCFGDAIHLTNWQTFIKNIILSVFIVFIFIKRKDKTTTLGKNASWLMLSVCIFFFLVFVLVNLRNLPIIDFRPYKPGTDINSAMAIPQDAPADKYDIRFIYKKDDVEKEFTLADYPANDTTWRFVDQKSVLVSKGYVPPIHDFSLVTPQAEDKTEEITSFNGYSLLMISKKIDEARLKDLVKGIKTGDVAIQNNIRFHILTSSSNGYEKIITDEHSLLFGDDTTLKTIIRSNPGFVMIKNGTVAAMWSTATLPDPQSFSEPEKVINTFISNNHLRGIITFSLFSLLILISIFIPYFVKH